MSVFIFILYEVSNEYIKLREILAKRINVRDIIYRNKTSGDTYNIYTVREKEELISWHYNFNLTYRDKLKRK